MEKEEEKEEEWVQNVSKVKVDSLPSPGMNFPILLLKVSRLPCSVQAHILMVVSQEAVPMAVPSGDTFNEETLFSCPYSTVILSHFRVSQRFTV